jgi:predicted ATPase with chaperone activity
VSNAERSPARVTASVGVVTVARAGGATRLPAEIQLAGAMNLCRRGCITPETCACTLGERARYLGRLSAPRTIADLAGAETIKAEHLAETLAYRALDHETCW